MRAHTIIYPVAAAVLLFLGSDAAAVKRVSLGVAPVESGRFVPDAVTALVQSVLEEELARSPRLDLVERSRLQDVLAELSFQQSGVTERAAAARIGAQENVQSLVFAQVVRPSSRYDLTGYRLSLKVVDVASDRVVWTDTDSLGRSDREVAGVTRRLARRLASMALAFAPTEMVFLAAGSFRMGSDTGPGEEQPGHVVSLSAFSIDRTEVSTASYNAYLVTHGRQPDTRTAPEIPVAMVSWGDAQAYCGWLEKRLPTEAEWEYAARNMSQGSTYPWGEALPDAFLARFSGGAAGPVAIDALSEGASAQGVLHLAGNVAEWVSDWWDPRYYAASPEADPRGPSVGDFRVTRGGSWSHGATEIRAAARGYHSPDRGAAYIGFRCARPLGKPQR